ncbi:unnamed protein product [Diatraea saccharalis]|nr:unnamed protein product [Diatraea saccharalis]
MDVDEKYSIKNLLFYRAIPPFTINEPIAGYKLFGCIDCGDRFVLESSYQDHINRKSVKISYTCRRCSASQRKIFYNRCNLLSHIRSHSFKTATINVSDLNIEPLPLKFFKVSNATAPQPQVAQSSSENTKECISERTVCVECNKDITVEGSPHKDRVNHYMKYTNRFHSCPVCLLTLPTICALKSHLRVHLKNPPYFCPECGNQLPNKIINYPFSHNCEGFNMMRATVRLECPVPKCQSTLFHPHDFKKHLKLDHMKKVFKCPYCVVACFSGVTISKHLETHQPQQINNILIFHQCEMCPGRLVVQNHLESHINAHINDNVYPCWTCGTRLKNIPLLINHHINQHITSNNGMAEELKNALKTSLECNSTKALQTKMFRVVKRCDQCLRSFSYKCNFDDIKILPNACPYKCTPSSKSLLRQSDTEASTNIVCPLCQENIDSKWENVKKHFSLRHKKHKCLDGEVKLIKTDLITRRNKNRIRKSAKNSRVRKRKHANNHKHKNPTITGNISREDTTIPQAEFICIKCRHECESKEDLEDHIRDHRDPCMEYQCLECGECFIVKPSFSTHLLINHGISDVDDYIEKKKCYNDVAFIVNQDKDVDMPLDENQCRICREKFDDPDDLEKHFRVHGMAFLMKNSQSKSAIS